MTRQTKSFLLARFREMGINPDTRHGQNFLIDLNLVDLIVSTADITSDGYPAERGYTVGFTVLGIVMALASLAALRIPDTHAQLTGGPLADAADGELGLVPAAGAVPPRA